MVAQHPPRTAGGGHHRRGRGAVPEGLRGRSRTGRLRPPGADDEWRATYRDIAIRYTPDAFADAYINATVHEPRALLSLPCDPAAVTSWRMPREGEDPAGVWAGQYYHRRPQPEEWVPERRV